MLDDVQRRTRPRRVGAAGRERVEQRAQHDGVRVDVTETAVPENGDGVGLWMCDAVVVPIVPTKSIPTCMVLATVSISTSATRL